MTDVASIEKLIAQALPVLEARHGEVWLVGGWVRDRLLGRETHDIDFVVSRGAIATARQVGDALNGAFVVLDVERDTARVVVGPSHAAVYLDFAGLRGPTLETDLLARDFTINAMAVPAQDWRASEPEVIDPAGGRRDLAEGLLRAVSPEALREDPLRTLRGVRLAALLDFQIESQTAAWIHRDAELLDTVSRERVRDEFTQILALPQVERSLLWLDELRLLEQVVPELAGLRAVCVAGRDEVNVFQHSLTTAELVQRLLSWLDGAPWDGMGWSGDMLEAALGRYRERLAEHFAAILPGGRSAGVLLTLAALLHDIGKGVAAPGACGQGSRFLAHEVLGASLAATIMRRLCFSSAETVRVRLTVGNHMRPGQMVQESGGEPSRRAIYRFFRDIEPSGLDTVLLSLVDHLATRGPMLDREHWRRHLSLSAALVGAYYERRDEIIAPPIVIDGHDLMSSLNLAPGPEVGGLLDNIREAQAAGEVHSRAEALALAEQLLAKGGRL